ncbi:MAG: DNA glycosylase AlkZ-like family protein [Candidatus Thorarchaeota archaeon]
MSYKIHELSKVELQKIAIVGTHLHSWQDSGNEGVLNVFQTQGMVQLDPLNPAGRNHDLFFLARIPDYKVHSFQKIIYSKKLVFEAYFPNLMAIYKEYLPIFLPRMKRENLGKYYSSRIEKLEKARPTILEEVEQFLEERGPSKSSDFDELAEIKPEFHFWKASRISGMGLEVLWLLGKAAIVDRDENWRKTYNLLRNHFDKDLLKKSEFTDKELNFQRFLIKQKSYPLMNMGKVTFTKSGKLAIGKKGWPHRFSPDWFDSDENENNPHILKIKEDIIGFAAPSDWEKMLEKEYDEEMKVIAPLDPLIWDRELALRIFDFDYVWEVYKVPKDRKWGYYVYPLLFKGELIGRMEAKYDKKAHELSVFNLQFEEEFKPDSELSNAFYSMLDRWKSMLSADKIKYDKSSLIK